MEFSTPFLQAPACCHTFSTPRCLEEVTWEPTAGWVWTCVVPSAECTCAASGVYRSVSVSWDNSYSGTMMHPSVDFAATGILVCLVFLVCGLPHHQVHEIFWTCLNPRPSMMTTMITERTRRTWEQKPARTKRLRFHQSKEVSPLKPPFGCGAGGK